MEQLQNYEREYWEPILKSKITEVVISDDESPSYEMDKFWIVGLENVKYATIHECGCSCYESSKAEIEILASKDACKEQYEKWLKSVRERARNGW
jgi:hypothetical protein